MKIGKNKNKWYVKDNEKIILQILPSRINSLIKALFTIKEAIKISKEIEYITKEF